MDLVREFREMDVRLRMATRWAASLPDEAFEGDLSETLGRFRERIVEALGLLQELRRGLKGQ